MFWAMLTTIAFALAAIAILINRQARLALRLMTFMLVLLGMLVWIPRLIAHPEAHLNWSEFGLTFLITGATWMVADLRSSDLGRVCAPENRATASVVSGSLLVWPAIRKLGQTFQRTSLALVGYYLPTDPESLPLLHMGNLLPRPSYGSVKRRPRGWR
jgi:hypothetical protein